VSVSRVDLTVKVFNDVAALHHPHSHVDLSV